MFAGRDREVWEARAPAKLNLYLDVRGRRADGFHELETLFVPIGIEDRLAWRPSRGGEDSTLRLQIHAATLPALRRALGADESNLAWRAAVRLAQSAGIEPTGRLTLLKRIPVQAGLGGGSSDAAATLRLLNAAWGVRYPVARLEMLASELGSDVPFFVRGRTAIGRGRGERLEALPTMPRLPVVVAAPAEGVATAATFRRHAELPPAGRPSPQRLADLVAAWSAGRVAEVGSLLWNGLTAAAKSLHEGMERLELALARRCPWGHGMSGSGAAWFGLVSSNLQARRLAAQLRAVDRIGAIATTTITSFGR